MLFSVNDTLGYRIGAVDGEIGSLSDVLFDDATSKARYLVVDTGSWLVGRSVLLGLAAAGQLEPDRKQISSALTRQQVKDSPDVETHQPVSRQQEEALHRYYGWSPYWEGAATGYGLAPLWGVIPPPPQPQPGLDVDDTAREIAAAERQGDQHLHSAREVIGYYVEASDGDIGHVEDLLIDDVDWTIRLIVVDTRNWLPGRKVLVAPDWLVRVDWSGRQIKFDLPRDRIKSSPEYDPAITVNRGLEEALYEHYGRTPYWA
jgi:hypothetical protein